MLPTGTWATKPGAGVAALGAEIVLWQLDDAVADRLGAAVLLGEAHRAIAEIGLRHGVGLDHLVPHRRLELGEILGGDLVVFFGEALGDRNHRGGAGALARAVGELGELAHEVADGKAGDARRLRVAGAAREVAEDAGARIGLLAAMGDDVRHLAVIPGYQSGGLKPSSICAWVYCLVLPGSWIGFAASGGLGGGLTG